MIDSIPGGVVVAAIAAMLSGRELNRSRMICQRKHMADESVEKE